MSVVKRVAESAVQYPSWQALWPIEAALFVVMFLVAIDATVIAPALPQITNDIGGLADDGWYASSYLMTRAVFVLPISRLYTSYSIKSVLLATIVTFEVGPLICGAARTSTVFVLGRAIAGLGAAGILTGALVCITYLVPALKRPLYTGILGSSFSIASITGPLIGGGFTSNVSWRWAFYINLCVGALAIPVLVIVLKLPARKKIGTTTGFCAGLTQIDLLGLLSSLSFMVLLLLALTWGGTSYAWGSGSVVVLLVLSTLSLGAFVYVEWQKQEKAMIPLRIVFQQSMTAGIIFGLFTGAAVTVVTYYLPLWFQSIKGVDAVQSGINILPMAISTTVACIVAAICTSLVGYYVPFMIASSVLMAIGAGLLTTLKTDTTSTAWVGYQILFGFGLGLGAQQPSIAAQIVLDQDEIAIGGSVMLCGQQLGSSVFISVAQNLFMSAVVQDLEGITGLSSKKILGLGFSELRTHVPSKFLESYFSILNKATTRGFTLAAAMGVLSLIGALVMEWKNVREEKEQNSTVEEPMWEADNLTMRGRRTSFYKLDLCMHGSASRLSVLREQIGVIE